MRKFAISALVIVAGVVTVQGSLFGPLGPFGPFGQAAAPPAFGPPTFGPPAFAQPGAFFPGFGYQPAVPVYQPVYPGFPAGFAPVPTPYAAPASRALVSPAALPAAPVAPLPSFRPKPSPVVQRLLLKLLPEDLQERLNQLLVSHEEGNAACDQLNAGFGPSVAKYRRCVVFNKITTEQAALALETEANDRAAAEQATSEHAIVDEEVAVEVEEADVVEESVTEGAAGAEEAENEVAEVAEPVDDADEPTNVVEENVDVDAEDVAVEESSTVA